jgi:hypothetical protein
MTTPTDKPSRHSAANARRITEDALAGVNAAREALRDCPGALELLFDGLHMASVTDAGETR